MTGFGPILRRLVEDFDDLRLRWALVGGLAVSARAEPRTTRDVEHALPLEVLPGVTVRVASLAYLVAMKVLAGRLQKDLLREFDRLSAQARNEH